MDVVVIGGGIVGLASAYELARTGATVTVLERATLGGGSTGRANGGIRAQFSTPANVRLSLESLSTWTRFENRFGVDIDFRQNGYLLLASDPDSVASFERNVEMQQRLGVPSKLLTGDDITRHSPGLHPDAAVAATFAPTDGYADPHAAVMGYVSAARDFGVEILTGTAVTAMTATTWGYLIETTDDFIEAPAVVNAAGPWSGRVAAMLDIDLPITPIRRQLALLEPDRPLEVNHPYTFHVDQLVSYRPERHPDALVSGNFEGAASSITDPDRYRRDIDLEFAQGALERLDQLTTYFGPESRLKGGWAGLYTVTPDHNPIIDAVRPGFVTATGFSGHGFMHAPATGRMVANLIHDEPIDVVDPTPFTLDRFDNRSSAGEGITP